MKRIIMMFMLMPLMALATTLSDGLVAHYKFDGNANDASGNGNDGVVHGSVLATDRNGNANAAYEFDGVDDWIEVPHSSSLGGISNALTIAFWIRPENWWDKSWSTPAIPFVCKADYSYCEGSFRCFAENYGDGTYFIGGFGVDANRSEEALVMNEWQHIVIARSGSSGWIYRNGKCIFKSDKCQFPMTQYQDVMAIGRDIVGGTTQFLDGAMDDLRIYNRALTASEVSALYGERSDGLVAWYRFDGSANDSSGNENDGIVHGAKLSADRFGNPDCAYSFDGVDDWIEVLHSSSLATVTNDFTVSLWVKNDSWWDNGLVDPAIPFVCKADYEYREGSFRCGAETTRAGFVSICGFSEYNTDVRLVFGEWQHFVIVIGNQSRLYRNGSLIASENRRVWDVRRYEDVLAIGRDIVGGTTQFIDGSMDDLRIYNRALSADEVGVIYNEGGDPIVYRTVTFDGNGGVVSADSRSVKNGAAVGELPTATREGYDFVGWFTAAVGGTEVTAATEVSSDVKYYAHWTAREYAITYSDLRGASNPNPKKYTIEDTITLVAPGMVSGYRFAGWSPSAIAKGSTGNKTVTASWTPIAYSITYAETKGVANSNPTTYSIESSVTFKLLSDVDGYRFVGWSIGGIARGTTGNVKVTALWEAVLPDIGGDDDDDEPMDASVANAYDGVIVDADGLPVGYINVKAAKASGKGEAKTSKVTATIQMVGEEKKVTVKATVPIADAAFTQKAADGRILDLTFSRYGIWGTFDDYEIDGVRNLLASKAKSDKGTEAKAQAEAVFAALKGNYVMAYGDESGYNGLSVTVMAKGKVNVSGKLSNGASVSTTTQLIVGSDYSVIPVIYSKKGTSLAFNIYISNDGMDAEVFGYYDAVISPVSNLRSGLSFYVGETIYDLFEDYELCDWFLPDGVSVDAGSSKWVVADGAKAGKIKVVDGDVIDTKESENPSGLKLTFKAKTGAFTGSFKVYALTGAGKLKTFTASVSGIVVDGYGYGVATIRGLGSCSVVIAE